MPATSAWRLWVDAPTSPRSPPRPGCRCSCAAHPDVAHQPARRGETPRTAAATPLPSAATYRPQQPPPCWIYLPRNPTRSDTAAPTPAKTSLAAPTAAAFPAPRRTTPTQLPACPYPPRTKSTISHRIYGAGHELVVEPQPV